MEWKKIRKQVSIISALITVFCCILYFGSEMIFVLNNDLFTIKDGKDCYCYYNENDTNKVYGVSYLRVTRWSSKIDAMLSYNNYKFKDMDYKYSDCSFIRSITNNTKVTIQEYLRDSSIVLVAFNEYNSIRNRIMPVKLYVPEYILHEKSRIECIVE